MNLLKPVSSEKYVRLMESENKICFEVDSSMKKSDIKKEVEQNFNVKVDNIKIYISQKGVKRAIVKLSDNDAAFDVATKLGLV